MSMATKCSCVTARPRKPNSLGRNIGPLRPTWGGRAHVYAALDSGARDRREILKILLGATAALSGSNLKANAFEESDLSTVDRYRLRIAEIDRLLKDDQENEQLIQERYLVTQAIKKIEDNSVFLRSVRPAIARGDSAFLQHLVLKVPDLEKSIGFWTSALAMTVVRRRGDKTAFLAYGPESLKPDDGGKFSLEIVQDEEDYDVGNALAYIQIGVPSLIRISKVFDYGGTIDWGYGYFEMKTPEGIPLRVYVTDRRDPFQLVALNCSSVEDTSNFCQKGLGMRPMDVSTVNSDSVYLPRLPAGSKLLGYGDNPHDITGVLLLQAPPDTPLKAGAYDRLAIVGNQVVTESRKKAVEELGAEIGYFGALPRINTRILAGSDSDSHGFVFVEYEDFESEFN